MSDRPAAELLAEWREPMPPAERVNLAFKHMEPVLERLARAEQALAEAKADVWDEGWASALCDMQAPPGKRYWNPYRAALRATQGGSDV